MNEPIPVDTSYRTVLVRFIDQIQTMEGSNLIRYHRIGQLFTEFLDGLTCGRYGIGASVKKLGEDLQRNGLLTEIRDPQRLLYYARGVFGAYPDPRQLADLAKQGFTVTHAKLLMACKADEQDTVLSKALVHGRFVPVREFRALVMATQGITSPSEAITDASEAEEPELLETPADGGPRHVELEATGPIEIQPDLPGNPPLPTPVAEPAPPGVADAATTNTLGRERTVAPKKALSQVNVLLEKLMVALPDVFIVVKESAQIGGDNDAAQKRYLETIADIAVAAKGVRAILIDLINEIDGEVGAGGARAVDP